MKDKRQGNDLKVAWSIFMQDGEPFRLEGKDVSLYLKNMFGRKELNDFVVTGNIIQWTFYGKDQKNTGKYSLELVINEGEKGMITTDKCDFVNLVSCSCKLRGGEDAPNVETESIELTSTLEYVSGGGDYDDTALWKAVDGKVDKEAGKGLSTNDYTDEDREKLAGLKNYDDAKLKEELSETYQPKENIYYFEWDSASGSGELDEATYQAIMAADKVCLKNGISITEPISKVSDGVECAYGFVADKYYVLFVFKSNYVIFPSPYYDDTKIKQELTELSAEIGKKQDTITDLETIRSGAAKGATAIQEVKTINGQSIVGSGNIEIQGGGESTKRFALLYETTIEAETDRLDLITLVPNILENREFVIEAELVAGDNTGRDMRVAFSSKNENLNACFINKINKSTYQTHYLVKIKIGNDWMYDSYCYVECHNNSWNNEQKNDGLQGLNLFAYSIKTYEIDAFKIIFPFKVGDKIRIYGK